MARQVRTVLQTQKERGSMSLFGSMVILPTFLFLFTLSFDIAGFYNEFNRAQTTVDDAALYAHNFLPDMSAAQVAAQHYVEHFSRLRGELSTSSTPDSISLVYSAVYRWWLGAFFNRSEGIPYQVSSSSGSVVTHVSILIDSSRYTAPISAEAWGSAIEWPEAPILSGQLFRNRNGESVSAHYATQQCFNPVSRSLKHSALSLMSYFSSFPKNAVGIGFFPGSRRSVEILQSTSPYVFTSPELDPSYLTVTHDVVRHLDCLMIARDVFSPELYRIPATEVQPVDRTAGYSADLPSRKELLWSRGVSEGSADIGEVLRALEAELLGAQKQQVSISSSALSYKPTKLGVVLLGDMPRKGALRFPDTSTKEALTVRIQSIIASQESNEAPPESRGALRLFFIILAHQGARSTREEAEDLQRFFDGLIAEYHESSENVSIQVLYGDDPNGLAQAVIRSAVLQGRSSLLRR